MSKLFAGIITIGDELLIGQVTDTNSAWMATLLNQEGIWVRDRLAVGDNREDILHALDLIAHEVEIILITGGLGPTDDDITKEVLLEYFGGRMIVDPDSLQRIRHIFEQVLRRPMIERNLKQAEVPDTCQVIPNYRGTAPGMWFEKERKIYVAMPGVPHEMKGMMTDSVVPRLRLRYSMPVILHNTLLTAGIGESFLAEHIREWEHALPAGFRLAYLPNYGMVRLRLTASGEDRQSLEAVMQLQFESLKEMVTAWMVTDENISLPQALGKLLREKGKTVGTAESCTGGYIAHLITTVPGSSDYFKGSIVSYSNDVKEDLLEVSKSTLAEEGAVSQQTVEQMAKGALKVLKTDYVVATSGIMGPAGGTEQKPVGTAWIAVAGKDDSMLSRKYFFRFDRERNIELTATNALNLLRELIKG